MIEGRVRVFERANICQYYGKREMRWLKQSAVKQRECSFACCRSPLPANACKLSAVSLLALYRGVLNVFNPFIQQTGFSAINVLLCSDMMTWYLLNRLIQVIMLSDIVCLYILVNSLVNYFSFILILSFFYLGIQIRLTPVSLY